MYIPSVNEAVKQIKNHYEAGEYEDLIEVKQYLESDKNAKYIAGDADRFHNATVELTRIGFYDYAYALAELGHKRYPQNTDLLGDLLCYGLQCRDLAQLEQWYNKLITINRRFWGWRAYQFSFDYWKERLPYAKSDQQLEEWEDKIKSIYADFKNNFKFLKDKSDCEKAYMMEYEFLLSKGEEETAIQSLVKATSDPNTRNKCPQCALTLADYYFGMGNYEEAYKYATIAINIKEDQPSINLGYTHYIRAMSKEAIERQSRGYKQHVQDIYNAYASAYVHLKDDGSVRLIDSVKKQVLILERETGVESGIDFSDSSSDFSSLMRLLSQNREAEEAGE